MLSITQPLHQALRDRPDAPATMDGPRRRTWRDVGTRARRFAGMLGALGVKPGDRVALLAPNGDLFMDFLFGTLWAGAVLNPVNTRWSAAEIAYSLVDSDSHVLVLHPQFLPLLAAIRAAAPCLTHVLIAGDAAQHCTDHEAVLDLEALLQTADEPDEQQRGGEDLAAILYTGGTTGAPKGVMLPHRALMTYAADLANSGESAPGAAMLHTAPLFHVGAISGLLASLLNGSRHVFLPAFEAGAVIAAIAEHRVTDLFLVPTMLQALLDHPQFGTHDLTCVEHVYYGAAPITAALMDRAMAAMPRVGFVQGYGMTETSGSISLLKPSDHARDDKVRTAGRVVPSIEVRIVDAAGEAVPAGTSGEVAARGAAVMQGYWGRPRETAFALRDGWMHTGDIGVMDADGYLKIVDRLKDMIVSGGENIYSIEVEGALASHPAVAQCAVIGLPHERWGESVHAEIVLHPNASADAEDLIAHCRAHIAAYKCPRSIGFRDAMPLSAAGKILKTALRADLSAAAG